MAISATLAALFFNLIPASYAATPVVKIVKPSVLSVEVVGETVTIKWSSPKLPGKAYFEVELKSKGETPTVKVVRATTTSLSRVLIPYTNYSVRVKSKAIAKGAWSNSKGFTTLGSPVNNVNITETTHTAVAISWEPAVGATGTTYLTVAGDVGYRIRVRETLTTNTGSSSVYTLTSPNLNPSS